MVAACIIYGILILLFLVLGSLFARGRGRKLIAGYNTMSEREREKIELLHHRARHKFNTPIYKYEK